MIEALIGTGILALVGVGLFAVYADITRLCDSLLVEDADPGRSSGRADGIG